MYEAAETFRTLYKKDSKGKVRVWSAELGIASDGSAALRTYAGIQGGKIIQSEWKKCNPVNVGKSNETTSEQQARNEIASLYTKKLDAGHVETLNDINVVKNFKPMLAASYDKVKIDFADGRDYYAQPKLDGIRCIAKIDGLFTRAGKEIVSCPHIHEALMPYFESNPNAVVDGELYNHALKDDFNKITSLVRKTKPTAADIAECAEAVEFHVYDLYHPESSEMMFSERFVINHMQDANNIILVETVKIEDEAHLNSLYSQWLEEGFEGQMVRIDAKYELKRTKNLLKRKEFLTDEFEVIEVCEGQGNWSGHIKRFVLRLENGEEFGAGVRGKQDVLRAMFENSEQPDWATVRYFTPTPAGVPRFPVVVDWGFGKRND